MLDTLALLLLLSSPPPEQRPTMQITKSKPRFEEGYDDEGKPRPGFRDLGRQLRSAKLSKAASSVLDEAFLASIQEINDLSKRKGGSALFAEQRVLPHFERPSTAHRAELDQLEIPGSPWIAALLEAEGISYREAKPGASIDPRTILTDASGKPTTLPGRLGKAKTWTLSAARVAWADEAHTRPSKLLLREHWVVGHSRSSWAETFDYLLSFDEEGRLESMIARADREGEVDYIRAVFERQDGGALAKISMARAGFDGSSNMYAAATAVAQEQVAQEQVAQEQVAKAE